MIQLIVDLNPCTINKRVMVVSSFQSIWIHFTMHHRAHILKSLLYIVLTAFSTAAQSGVISLDVNFYWQVQKFATHETVCEGFISTCVAPDGIYDVINLSTGERENGVRVTTLGEPSGPILTMVEEQSDRGINNFRILPEGLRGPSGNL